MQTLEVISVNLWNIVYSLANLTIIFLLVKKFLFKPIQNVLAARQNEIDARYAAAQEAEEAASNDREIYAQKLTHADNEVQQILADATARAQNRADRIVTEARDKADGIVRQAQTQADLEMKKAEAGIKREIVDVSALLTEKLLGREINAGDHRDMIDSFIDELGDNHG